MKSFNIMIASLALGGAERIVCETISALRDRGVVGRLFVLWSLEPSYKLPASDLFYLHPWKAATREAKLLEVASEVLRSGNKLLFTHLISVRDLEVLWRVGVQTVPVIHNAREGWQDPATSYAASNVPFVVAVAGSVAAEMKESGCTVPIITIRHELQRWYLNQEATKNRIWIRERHHIPSGTFLIGMVGSFKAQKAYPRAARILAQVRRSRPAKLMILGSWDHDYGYGRVTYDVFCRLVEELGLQDDVLLPGSVEEADAYYSAFDAYLNTSVFEGLSVALLEAQQWGCPVVTADAGGNSEALVDGSVLVRDPSDIAAYVDALLSLQSKARVVSEKPAYPDLVPRIWSFLNAYGVDQREPRSGVLFVTDNLNMGGAQRSLTNLLVHMPDKSGVAVCLLGAIHGRDFLNEIARASIPLFTFGDPANVVDTAARVFDVIDQLRVQTVCFWNADASVKLLVSKILSATDLRIVDVSPGGTLFRELDETRAFQRRISYTESEYLNRLDRFVCKCDVGTVNPRLTDAKAKVVVIRNGVPMEFDEEASSAPAEAAMRIGTCGRIVPENRLEFLLDTFAIVSRRYKEASLTIVGDTRTGRQQYKEFLLSRIAELGLKGVHFVRATNDVTSQLKSFRVFVTAFAGEGCSNAVLESMAAGTPAVVTVSPSNQELIEDGVDGFVVSDPQEMAARIEILLKSREVADSISRAARNTVKQRFSMGQMVNNYCCVLAG
jgi:glycosyltransferase involved in cell wall biosynthesis